MQNTDESSPDGVYWRSKPDPDTAVEIEDFGVYKDQHVKVKCFSRGEKFGPNDNDVWYYAFNTDVPVVNGKSNEGWINTHYVDDGMTAGKPKPGVRDCTSATNNGGSGASIGDNVAFYSGRGDAGAATAKSEGADVVLTDDGSFDGQWRGSERCKPDANAVDGLQGKDINRLAGWSLGRLGPIYALHYMKSYNQDAAQRINYVILYDPASEDEMRESCDFDAAVDASGVLAWWLGLSDDNRLIIISNAELTGKDGHAGIQGAYFSDIKEKSDLRKRTLVCNYSYEDGHEKVYNAYADLMTKDRLSTDQGLSTCPPQNGKEIWGWNP